MLNSIQLLVGLEIRSPVLFLSKDLRGGVLMRVGHRFEKLVWKKSIVLIL